MEELFDLGERGPEGTEISLWIFPHLKEFLAIDLRGDAPAITLMNTADVFSDRFFGRLEEGFGQILREGTDHPFAHLIDLPLRVEELVREMGMLTILSKLSGKVGEDEFPKVAVFIISGAALAMSSQQVSLAFRSMLGDEADPAMISGYAELLERLLGEEYKAVKSIDQQELREALEDQSPNFFTLWERRN